MGWASGGEIFDCVAKALIDAEASDDIKRNALGRLIGSLQDGDWDTEDESLERFKDDQVIVELFRERGITLDGDDGDDDDGDDDDDDPGPF